MKLLRQFDIPLGIKKDAFSNMAVRNIHCGGERVRKMQIWYDSVGTPQTVRVFYEEEYLKVKKSDIQGKYDVVLYRYKPTGSVATKAQKLWLISLGAFPSDFEKI